MGTKNCPESPRQKMINMMYIVLTAMLAINVAAEVLEAFRVVDLSLNQTLKAVDSKNRQTYNAFAQAYEENPEKVKDWKAKADDVRAKTDSMIVYLRQLKENLVVASGTKSVVVSELKGDEFLFVKMNGDTVRIKKEDDINTPSEIMIAQKKAQELKAKLETYKNYMVGSIAENNMLLRATIEQELETADPKFNLKLGERKTWETQHFDSKPLAAILTIISKMQIDIKNTEANVVNYLFSQIDAASYKFNKLQAQVIANSGIILQGEEYKAEIFLAAIDTTVDPEIIVNGRALQIVEGKGVYSLRANTPGVFKWNGMIKYKTPDGQIQSLPFDKEYQVTSPSVTISPTKMNVFYQNIPNPIDVSVPGIPKENLRIEITNGKLTQNGNEYLVYPKDLDEFGKRTSITVFARVLGTERSMGTKTFRVKRVPDPVAMVGNQSGGNIKKEDLAIEDGVAAILKDFDFELRFTITQFDVSLTGAGGYVNTWKSIGNRFTSEQKGQFRALNTGSIVVIDNLKAKGDDGTLRDLSPISFKIR